MKFNSGQFKKGQTSPNKGKVASVETRMKMRLARLGKKVVFTAEHCKNLSLACSGKPRPWLQGKKRIITDEWRRNMSLARRKRFSDRTLLKKRDDRKSQTYTDWRIAVISRDENRCKMEDSNCLGILEVHHIFPWRDYVELRHNISNGILLCKYHHPRKREEAARLGRHFTSLITKR